MYETNIVIVGNVLTAPEWRRTPVGNHLMTRFRVASTSRRFDRESGRWVDGDHLRVRVTCWRRLAENVGASLTLGDPVIVVGRLFTRDWTDDEGNRRIAYEMEAVAVGHDQARGKSKLFRNKSQQIATTEAEESEAMDVVRGETVEPVPAGQIPAGYGDGMPAEVEEPEFDEYRPAPEVTGITPPASAVDGVDAPEASGEPASGDAADESRGRRRSRREPVPA